MLQSISARAEIARFLARMHPQFQRYSVTWDSQLLEDKPVTDLKRLKEIHGAFSLASLPKDELAKVQTVFNQKGIWDLYLNGPYPCVVGYSGGFQATIHKIHKALKDSKVVLELGTGPGLILSSLLHLKRREGIGIERSLPALALARQLCSRAAKTHGSRFRLIQGDFEKETITSLLRRSSYNPSPDAVVLHNVAYVLSDRKRLLKEVYDLLPLGGRLILVDPQPILQLSPESFLKRSRKVSTNALKECGTKLSPFTEHQLATVSYVGAQVLASPKALPFLSGKAWQRMCERSGFRVVSGPAPTYYGISSFLVLEK